MMDFIFDPSLALYSSLGKRDGISFTSDDAYGHAAAVTGAVWTSRGRSFDGVDDYMNVASASCDSLRSATISIEYWFKPGVVNESTRPISFSGADAKRGWLIRQINNTLAFILHDSLQNRYQFGFANSGYLVSCGSDIR